MHASHISTSDADRERSRLLARVKNGRMDGDCPSMNTGMLQRRVHVPALRVISFSIVSVFSASENSLVV